MHSSTMYRAPPAPSTDPAGPADPIQNTTSISFKVAFNQETHDEFTFRKPEEAPVFRPTSEEFKLGPLEYIKKIRPYAEQFGICRIIPPSEFKPAFEVDPNKFMFKPRVQRINELEALTRAKLCFFEKIIKYWNLQGVALRIPTITDKEGRKIVDLYKLHRTVFEEGGFETCVREKKWMKIATKLYPASLNKSTTGSLLKQHYERILYPYDIFASGATTGMEIGIESKFDSNNNYKVDPVKSEPVEQPTNGDQKPSNKRNVESDEECDEQCVKKGKTGRTVSRRSSARLNSMANSPISASSSYTKMMNINDAISNSSQSSSPAPAGERSSSVFCKLCNLTREQDRSRKLLECDSCKDNFHTDCLIIPLSSTPKGRWNCPKCVADLVPKLPKLYTHDFGFAESRCKYTLSEFQETADKFKSDYFDRELDEISCDMTEKEFWRLVTCLDDLVTVEYGADLHTNQVGSGFASLRNERNQNPDYISHPWNLNKLPLLEGSLFRYINSNINGMVAPWLYVGMCYSVFCWHTEDHWTYSINYNHFGDVKTWYGIPGKSAEKFEEAMVATAPELFDATPDLLHQLVTICNPNILQEMNVPIYRTNQAAGEFVVTFPRAYHAGFNQGFNVAEAVNFAPPDWLEIGRECMANYSKMRRYPVFSHDELICNMSTDERLNASLLSLVYFDLLGIVQTERNLRKEALEYGITRSQAVQFNTLPDDERQCDFCKTTCYLSALTCECEGNKLVCLQHMRELCKRCESDRFVLKYTFKLDELVTLLKSLEQKLRNYEKFQLRLKRTVDCLSQSSSSRSTSSASSSTSSDDKIELKELIELQKRSKQMNVSNKTELIVKLNESLSNARYLQEKANNMLLNNGKERVTIEEFKAFIDDLSEMNIVLDRQEELFDLYEEANRVIGEMKKLHQQNKRLDSRLISKYHSLSFLNLDHYVSDKSQLNEIELGNRSTGKRKRVNRISNQLICIN